MKLKACWCATFCLAISAQAYYTYIPINPASLQPWTYLNAATGTDPNAGPDFIIKYTVEFTTTKLADVQEAFREYSAIFSAVRYPWGRIVFQMATPNSGDVQLVVTSNSISGNIAGAGCNIVNGKNSCTVYLGSNTKSARYWIGRALGVPASTSYSDVLGLSSGTSAPFTANDLNLISSTYAALGLDPNGTPYTKPMFLADYTNAPYGSEIVIGWDALRARMVNNQNIGLSGTFKTIAAVQMLAVDGISYPLEQYQLGYSSAWFTWWPYQPAGQNYTSMAPTYIASTDNISLSPYTPYPGEGTACSWAYSYSNITQPNGGPSLMAWEPSKGMLLTGRLGLSFSRETVIPSQYITPVYFYQAGLSYMASTRQPNSSCYRLGGYAFSVE